MGHRISVARSKTLMGNYEPCPYNPIMRQMDEGAAIQRCGHGKPVCTQNGEWYMVYLCGRMIGDGYSMLGRETALDPISWTADGWPVVIGSAEKTGSSGVDAGRRAGYWLEPKMDDTTCTGAGRNPFSLISNPYQREPFSTQRCGF